MPWILGGEGNGRPAAPRRRRPDPARRPLGAPPSAAHPRRPLGGPPLAAARMRLLSVIMKKTKCKKALCCDADAGAHLSEFWPNSLEAGPICEKR